MGLMSAAGGLLASKLAKATAAVGDVVQGKTFYAGDKTLKTGTLALSGSAGTGDVRKGKTFYSTNPKSRQTGTLEDRGAWGTTIDPGGSVTVPAGIHSGGGKVTANRGSFSGSGSNSGEGSWAEIYRNESNVTREIQARSNATVSVSGRKVTVTVHAEAYQEAHDIPELSGVKSSTDYTVIVDF